MILLNPLCWEGGEGEECVGARVCVLGGGVEGE